MKQTVVPKKPVYKQQDLLLLLLRHKHGLNIVPHKEGGQFLHTLREAAVMVVMVGIKK